MAGPKAIVSNSDYRNGEVNQYDHMRWRVDEADLMRCKMRCFHFSEAEGGIGILRLL